MIALETILTPSRSRVNVAGGSKKKALESVAALLAEEQPGIDPNQLFDSLVAREKLGSTGFGNGIAIPHCRLDSCTTPMGAILRLDSPVDFDAIDGAPVDLLFVLLVPTVATEEHLDLLRQIASLFNSEYIRQSLRQAPDDLALYQTFLTARQSGSRQ